MVFKPLPILKRSASVAQVDEQIGRLDAIVRHAKRRFERNWAAGAALDGEPFDHGDDPFEALARREEEAMREAAIEALDSAQVLLDLAVLPQALVERIHAEVFDQFRQFQEIFIEWLFCDGPQPLDVMRRLYAYVKMTRANLLYNAGFRHIGPMLGETAASAQWRCRALFGDTPAGWKKPAESVEKMRAAQQGNNNRRGGKKALPPEWKPSNKPTRKQQ